MINTFLSMAAWKGMSQKNFPLWTLINAYNQQPERLLEMQRGGFFPTEQGPMPFPQNALPAQGIQRVTVVDEKGVEHTGTLHQPTAQDHSTKLEAEVKELRAEVKQQTENIDKLLKYNTQQHRRIQDVEKVVKQIPATPTP